jgi:hypothetical protein
MHGPGFPELDDEELDVAEPPEPSEPPKLESIPTIRVGWAQAWPRRGRATIAKSGT